MQLTFIFLAKIFLSKLHFRGYLFHLALIHLFQTHSNPSLDAEFTVRASNTHPNSYFDIDVERNESQYNLES